MVSPQLLSSAVEVEKPLGRRKASRWKREGLRKDAAVQAGSPCRAMGGCAGSLCEIEGTEGVEENRQRRNATQQGTENTQHSTEKRRTCSYEISDGNLISLSRQPAFRITCHTLVTQRTRLTTIPDTNTSYTNCDYLFFNPREKPTDPHQQP